MYENRVIESDLGDTEKRCKLFYDVIKKKLDNFWMKNTKTMMKLAESNRAKAQNVSEWTRCVYF